MNKELQKQIFKAVLDFESQGEILEEKELVILGCMANGSRTEVIKKVLTTLDLEKLLPAFSLDEINKNTQILADKGFLRITPVTTTTKNNYYEINKSLADWDEFLDEF